MITKLFIVICDIFDHYEQACQLSVLTYIWFVQIACICIFDRRPTLEYGLWDYGQTPLPSKYCRIFVIFPFLEIDYLYAKTPIDYLHTYWLQFDLHRPTSLLSYNTLLSTVSYSRLTGICKLIRNYTLYFVQSCK